MPSFAPENARKIYSRVPNKREVGENNRGWKWFDITIIGGGGCFEKLKVVVFLVKHISSMYLCGQ